MTYKRSLPSCPHIRNNPSCFMYPLIQLRCCSQLHTSNIASPAVRLILRYIKLCFAHGHSSRHESEERGWRNRLYREVYLLIRPAYPTGHDPARTGIMVWRQMCGCPGVGPPGGYIGVTCVSVLCAYNVCL